MIQALCLPLSSTQTILDRPRILSWKGSKSEGALYITRSLALLPWGRGVLPSTQGKPREEATICHLGVAEERLWQGS